MMIGNSDGFLFRNITFQYKLMSWWSKLLDNKGIIAAVGAVGATALVFWAYMNYKEEQQPEEKEIAAPVAQKPSAPVFNIQAEIAKLRTEINTSDPSLEDIKKILTILANYVKQKTMALSTKFKEERRKRFPKEKRFSNIGEYYRYSNEGLNKLQGTIMQLQGEQQQLMNKIGISQASISKYAAQLGPFMQELVFSSNISLEDVRKSIDLKTEYLEQHGEKLIEELIELGAALSNNEKQNIALFLNIVISDQVFQNEPELDSEEFDMAYQKYKADITPELMKLQKILMPLMGQLQTALIGDQMGGMGGMGGFGGQDFGGMGGQDFGGMGGMPGMDGMGGFSEEAMMQQIEMLRQQDPQAYEQLMAMMSAQMGR